MGYEDLMIVFSIDCVNYSAENELFLIKAKWLRVATCEGYVKIGELNNKHSWSVRQQSVKKGLINDVLWK